jgi:3-oxoacyl-(acyl-carrier-protein) synthase III
VKLPVRIAGTSSIPVGPVIPTAEIVKRVEPPRDPDDIERRTGIASRRFAPRDATAAELGASALASALERAALSAHALERIILVTSGGVDLIFPATANLIAARLGLAMTCDCFDLANACLGFLTALDIAARGIATGSGPVGIAVVELPSRRITPSDPRPYLVFGDAATAAVITPARGREGVLGSWLRNDGIAFGNVRLESEVLTGRIETIRFTASHATIGREAIDAIEAATRAVLKQAELTLDEVDWVLPHQPNGALLDAIVQALGVDPARVVPVVRELGSAGAASIPVSLDVLMRERPVRAGDRVLMVGVGAGLSCGAMLYEVGD